MLVDSAESIECPAVCRSTDTSAIGRITASSQCASICENVPFGLPGKQRLISQPSSGDRRLSAITAGMFTAGSRITRPCTRPGSSSRASREIAMGPSYSSPWRKPEGRLVGRDPARGHGPRADRRAHRCRDQRLRQRLHRRPAGRGGPRGARAAVWRGENALEPERVTEKLHQNTFWMGRGGTLTHVISGIDIALWDILGKATGMPVGRLLGGRHRDRVQPYCSLLMEMPERMADVIGPHREAGVPRLQDRLGPVRAATIRARRGDRPGRARGRRGRRELLVDAGASDAYWPQRAEMGAADRRDAGRLRRRLVRGGAAARCHRRFRELRRQAARCRSPAARC
jgi:hypothetical protein